MTLPRSIIRATFLALSLMLFASGCVVEPREGYYDREHHRWYHEHAWHGCDEHDPHCY
jgi:hypothetical protein